MVGSKCARLHLRGGGGALVASRKSRVGVRDSEPMPWIVCPTFTVEASVSVAAVPVAVKSMAVEEVVVDEYGTAEPVRAPAPAAPEAEVNAGSPSKSICRQEQRR